jgi:ferredoxin
MIVAKQKPIAELKEMLRPYKKVLILGCGTCVKTCYAGGEDEVAALASALRLAFGTEGITIETEEQTVERQCEDAFIQEAVGAVARSQAVLSLACGAGVQTVARRFPKAVLLPGVNTDFIGVLEKPGLFTEECSACGDCELDTFGGICPITRCSKRLMNGPCGGSKNGKCEVNQDIDCAWQLIIDKLTAQNKLDNLKRLIPAKNWRTSLAGGPRKLIREDHVV